MSTLTLPTDAIATIPVLFTDQIGRPTAIPAGGAVSIDTTAVAVVGLTGDGSAVVVTPVAVGTATILYSNGALSAPLGLVVVTPSATTASFGTPVISAPAPADPAS